MKALDFLDSEGPPQPAGMTAEAFLDDEPKPAPGMLDQALGALKGLFTPQPAAPQPAPMPQVPNVLAQAHAPSTLPGAPGQPPPAGKFPFGIMDFAQAAPVPGMPTPSGNAAIGALEALATLQTAPVGLAAAGLKGLSGLRLENKLADPNYDFVQGVADKATQAAQDFTYQPKTELGQKAVETIFKPLHALNEWTAGKAQEIYDNGLPITDPETGNVATMFKGDAFMATLISVVPEVAIGGLPFLGRLRKGPSKALGPARGANEEVAAAMSEGARIREILKTQGREAFENARAEAIGKRMNPENRPTPEPAAAPKAAAAMSAEEFLGPKSRFAAEEFNARFMRPQEAAPAPMAPQPPMAAPEAPIIPPAAAPTASPVVPPVGPEMQRGAIPPPKKEAPIVKHRKTAQLIESAITQPMEGMTRLWRGNRIGEIGKNPQFTNDLAGIALPFSEAYGGGISYVDVPTADLPQYESTGAVASGAEFVLPKNLASQAIAINQAKAPAAPPSLPETPATAGVQAAEAGPKVPDVPPWKARGQEKTANPPKGSGADSPEMEQWKQDKEYLIQNQLAGKPIKAASGKQEVILTTGATGSGKSTGLAFAMKGRRINKDETVFADSDIMKKAAGWGAGDDVAAFHERSSEAAKELRTRAINAGMNTVYDSLGKNYDDIQSVIDLAIEKNLSKVIHVVMDVDAETSVARALQRRMLYDLKTGKPLQDRKIDFDVNIEGYNQALPTFKHGVQKRLNDPNYDFYVYDNNADGPGVKPTMVLQQENGIVTIGDKKLFAKWLAMDYSVVEKGGGTNYERSNPARREQIERNFASIYQRARRGAEAAARSRANVGVRDLPEYRDLIERSESVIRSGDAGQLGPEQSARKLTPQPEATPAAPPPQPASTKAKYTGESQKLVIPGQASAPVRFALMETADIIASHDPMSFGRNAAYPADVQERLYHSDKGEQAKVITRAQNLKTNLLLTNNPDAVNGPPIVTPEGVVLGGNSRAMLVSRAYQQDPQFGKGTHYRTKLAKFAGQFGLDPAAVEGMERPQLVRIYEPPDNEARTLRRLASDFNKSLTQGMSQEARTASMGKNVDPRLIESIGDALANQDKTIREYLETRGIEVLDRMITDGVIPAGDRSQYYSAKYNKLNDAGKDTIERILLGSVIDDADLLTVAPKEHLNKIGRALPDIVKVKARGDDWDITPQLKQALEVVTEAKAADNKTLVQYFSQQGLFGESKNADPAVRAIAEKLWSKDGPLKFAGLWKDFARHAAVDIKKQTFLFKPKSAEEAFREVFGGELKPAAEPALAPAKPPPDLSGMPTAELGRSLSKPLSKIEVEVTYQRPNGSEVKVKQNAQEALKEVDEQLDMAKRVLDCMEA